MGYISKLPGKQSIIKFSITKNDKTALSNITTHMCTRTHIKLTSEALLKHYVQIWFPHIKKKNKLEKLKEAQIIWMEGRSSKTRCKNIC